MYMKKGVIQMRKSKNKLIFPVLKWVGGKRQLLHALTPLLPQRINAYCEPFVGGGALLFDLQPNTAYVNDINGDLIRVYNLIKSDVEALVTALQDFKNEADYFYAVRDWDRDKAKYSALSDVQKAARILYLNKTCYNGLFRVNNAGEFNSPFGNYRNPNIVNAPTLRAVSSYLNTATIHLTSVDYAEVLKSLPKGTFVYLDPPYDPVSGTSNFTGYSKGGFNRDDQIRLRECCDDLHKRGLKFMLSNSATDFIKEQYAAYNITAVQAKRAVNSDSTKRGEVDEVVVRNYE
jgi:DNA adenine methylase